MRLHEFAEARYRQLRKTPEGRGHLTSAFNLEDYRGTTTEFRLQHQAAQVNHLISKSFFESLTDHKYAL
jgi:hypothetical protein